MDIYNKGIYNNKNKLVATSGELLHNSSNDTQNYFSTDTWTTKYSLELGVNYTLIYSVKTVNGLKLSSKPYIIQDRQASASTIFKYYDFVAEHNFDSACVDLYLRSIPNKKRKKENGRKNFI